MQVHLRNVRPRDRIRFYKSAANTGTHVGSLWSACGERLGDSRLQQRNRQSGWQQVNFSTPVDVHPNTTYVASYFAPVGPLLRLAVLLLHAAPDRRQHPEQPAAARALGERARRQRPPLRQRRLRLRLHQQLPDQQLPRDQLLGRARVRTHKRGGTGHERQRHREQPLGDRQLESAVNRRTGHQLHDHPVHRLRSTAGHDDHRHAAGEQRDGHRTDRRHQLHVHRAGVESRRRRSDLANHPTPSHHRSRRRPPHRRVSRSAQRPSRRLSAGPRHRTTAAAPITGYTVTPYIGSTAQTPVEVPSTATSATVTDLTNGTSYTFTVAANNVGASPSSAVRRSHARGHDLRLRDARRRSTRATANAVELGVKFTSEVAGNDHRHPLLQGDREHRHARRQPLERERSAARLGHFTSETATGWQQVSFSSPVAIAANTTYIAGYLAPKGHYSDTSAGFASAGANNPPLSALANAIEPNGVYATADQHLPDSTYNATNYWVDVDVRTHARAGPGHERKRDRRLRLGKPDMERARERRAGHHLHDHPLHRLDSAAGDEGQRLLAPDQRDGHGLGRRHQLHVHRPGIQHQRLRARVDGIERRRAVRADRSIRADGGLRERRHEAGARELDRAGEQRRQRDHLLHDHARTSARARRHPSKLAPPPPRRSSQDSPTAPATPSPSPPTTPSEQARRRAHRARSRRRTRSSTSRHQPRSTPANRPRSRSASSSPLKPTEA